MNYPTLLWNRDIFCSVPGCGLQIARQAELSDMRYRDGSPYEPGVSDMLVSGYFALFCEGGHENDANAPRDATIMGGNPAPDMCTGPIAVIRSLMGL